MVYLCEYNKKAGDNMEKNDAGISEIAEQIEILKRFVRKT